MGAGQLGEGRVCTFEVAGSRRLGHGGSVTALFSAYGSTSFYQAKEHLISTGAAVDASGIGDDAIYTVATHAVVLIKGAQILTVSVSADLRNSGFAKNDPAWRAAVSALARAATENLPRPDPPPIPGLSAKALQERMAPTLPDAPETVRPS